MTEPGAGFSEYGLGGDQFGARRARRAFRCAVMALVLFTGGLWLAEYFLRYDQSERIYISAVTQATDSARAMLKSAVKYDERNNEKPTPKYAIALAERETDDDILAAYAHAYTLDPDDPFLAIRYGCQLFQHEQFKDARERFREATAQPVKNALPGYLEAAAAQFAIPENRDVAESLALVARTNSSGDPVLFPKPSWPSNVLPQDGAWYAQLRRDAVDESCAPLYKYTDFILQRATTDIEAGRTQYWESWLVTIQEMGARIAESPSEGSVQAMAGLLLQQHAIELRIHILPEGETIESLLQQFSALRAAVDQINAFESQRDRLIAEHRSASLYPIALCLLTELVLIGLYILAYLLSKILRTGRRCWTVSHSGIARGFLVAGCLAILIMLTLISLLDRNSMLSESARSLLIYPWTGIMVILTAFGVFYPSLRLPNATDAATRQCPVDTPSNELIAQARQCRRVAGATLLRRYYGLLLGLFTVTACLWITGFRILVTLYPWQIKLLTTGLGQEEAELVRSVLAALHG